MLCSSPPTPVLIETGALAAEVLVEKLATAIQKLEDSRQQPPAPAQPAAPVQPAAVQEPIYPDSVDEDLYGEEPSEAAPVAAAPVAAQLNTSTPEQPAAVEPAAVDATDSAQSHNQTVKAKAAALHKRAQVHRPHILFALPTDSCCCGSGDSGGKGQGSCSRSVGC